MQMTKYYAPLLAAAAIGAAISVAPVALAATPDTATTLQQSAAADRTASPAPAPTPPQTGGDPAVPFGPAVDFNVDNFDGNSLAY